MGRVKNLITDLDLVDEMVEQAAAALQEEIDKEIVFAALKEGSWHLVVLDRFLSREHSVDVIMWIEENCTGQYHTHGREFLFENRQDAVLFSLKWL